MRSAGFLVIDKPAGITSHDVVAIVRAVTGVKKVGHTGTLDPFATGVLPLAIGGATKLIQYLDESIKVYDATIRLGSATDTGDPTGEVIREAPVPELDVAQVEAVVKNFLGDQQQTPPPYSAVKHKGRPLYWYARQGIEVTVEARKIHISSIDVTSVTPGVVRLLITCGRGTYARVLADEIAVALGTAGHLEALSRHRSGPFFLEDALSVEKLSEMVAGDPSKDWREVLMSRGPKTERVPWRHRDDVRQDIGALLKRPIDALSQLALADVDAKQAERIRKGGVPPVAPSGVDNGQRYLVVEGDQLVAIAERTVRGPKVLRTI
jgi:tRNA pseudouridine55 synthase